MTSNLLFNILMALIVAVAGIVARELLPYIKQKREEAEAKLRNTKWAWAVDIINAVVRAVEQTVSEEIHGEEKKQIAIEYIEQLLKQNGIELSAEQIDALIEAAVKTMNESTYIIETAVE